MFWDLLIMCHAQIHYIRKRMPPLYLHYRIHLWGKRKDMRKHDLQIIYIWLMTKEAPRKRPHLLFTHHHTYHSLTIIDSILFIYWSFGCLPPLHPSSHLSFSYYYWFDCYIFSLHLLILWLSTSSLICCPFKGFNWRRL